MLTYSFAERGDTPLYEYLYERVRADILSGTLSKGTRLPSKRAFAVNLGVSTVTVENAYGQLLAEGYIYSEAKRGYFVADVADILPDSRPSAPQEEEGEKPSESQEHFADFTGGRGGGRYFPFSLWSKLMRGLLSERREELLTNPPPEGVPELRKAIAAHLMAFRGMDVPWERIVIGSGTEYLYSLLVRLIGPEKLYAVEDPGYTRPYQVYTDHRARCVRVSIDGEGMPPEALEDIGADIAHISPSHHFPTGQVMPAGRRYALLNWACGGEERWIIEDDYDSELRLSGRPIPALKSIDTRERVIYMNTFSRTLASTIRAAYMILPEDLYRRFRAMRYHSCTVPNFEQYTLAAFIGSGAFEKHLNRMRALSRNKRDRLLSCLRAAPNADKVEILGEDAGLHFLLRVRTDRSDAELIRRAEENGLRIAMVSQYASDRMPEHTLVVSYLSLEDETMPEAAEKLIGVLTEGV